MLYTFECVDYYQVYYCANDRQSLFVDVGGVKRSCYLRKFEFVTDLSSNLLRTTSKVSLQLRKRELDSSKLRKND